MCHDGASRSGGLGPNRAVQTGHRFTVPKGYGVYSGGDPYQGRLRINRVGTGLILGTILEG